MNLQQRAMIKQIEIALGFKLYNWQKKHILTGEFNPPSERGVGKTTAYCVRLALTDKSYSFQEIEKLCDENHGPRYPRWFRNEFLKIRDILEQHGFSVCEINHKGNRG